MKQMSQEALLQYISEISFSVYDTLLYLDTHPADEEALDYYREYNEKRTAALAEYARKYGPLTSELAGASPCDLWKWSQQPWPWEGGNCQLCGTMKKDCNTR